MTRLNACGVICVLLVTGCCDGPVRAPREVTVHFSRHVVPADVDSPQISAPTPVFATYNVHWLQNAVDLRADLARLDFVTAWAFQEVRSTKSDEREGSPSKLCALLPPGMWYVAWVALNPLKELHRDDECEGQVIASRFPIRSADVWELHRWGQKRRIALAAVLDISGQRVLFVNTDHEPALLSLVRGNARQTRTLVEHLAAHDEYPAVVAGDFNTSGCIPRLVSARQDRAQLRMLMCRAGFSEAFDQPRRTYTAGPFTATLDHIFLRGVERITCDVDERARGSDHRPVWCRVEIHRANASAGATSAPAGMTKPTR